MKEHFANLRNNTERIKALETEYEYLFPNHNSSPISKSYTDELIGLVDAVYDGTTVIEDKLNHPFIEMDPRAEKMCRVKWKNASIFIMKVELMKVYGKGKQ